MPIKYMPIKCMHGREWIDTGKKSPSEYIKVLIKVQSIFTTIRLCFESRVVVLGL